MSLFNVKRKGLGFLSLSAPQCRACPVDKHMFPVSGNGEQEILIVVDSPSDAEIVSNKPFVGDKYDETDMILSEMGISLPYDCWKLHAMACYTEDEKLADKAVECCRPHFEDQVKSLKPKLIIALGGAASKAVLGSRFSDTSVGRWRGIPLFHPEFNCWVMITYDPSWNTDARTYDTYTSVITEDIALGLEHLKKPAPKKLKPNIKTLTDFDDIVFELERLLEKAEEVAVDYETTGLKPSNAGHRIVANSFTYSYNNGKKIRTISYPISYKGFFNKRQRRIIKDLTRQILISNIPKIGHHSKFEDIWGNIVLKTKTNNWVWCTMYTAHLLDERPKHVSLKTQAFIHFQAEPYEEKTKKYLSAPEGSGGNGFNRVDKCPILDLLYYNGLDTYYTFLLYRKQKAIVRKNPTLAPIVELFLEGALLFSDMEQTGFGTVPGYFREKDAEVRKLVKEKKRIILETEEAKKFNKKFKIPFSFRSDDHLNKMIYSVMGTEQFKKTKTGKGSTDNEVMSFLEKQGSTFAKEYVEYARLCKARDTFIAQMLLEENAFNRIHPMYSLSTTRTGRSCIAKGTKIEVVRDVSKHPKGINIEDVKVGDLVYCYDDNRNLTLKKVLWSGKTGTKEVVEVHWRSHGGAAKGVVKMTPEHKIRAIDGKYYRADRILQADIKRTNKHSPKCRVLALLRKKQSPSVLYITGQKDTVLDHRFIYEQVNGPIQGVIHHKDGNHFNGNPENLLDMSRSCHSLLHSESVSDRVKNIRIKTLAENRHKIPRRYGRDNPNYEHYTKPALLRMLFTAKGELTKIPHDFEVIKKKFLLSGIDVDAVKRRFTKKIGYLSRGMLKKAASMTKKDAIKFLGTSFYKMEGLYQERGMRFPWKEKLKRRVLNNHVITDVIHTGEICDVYDLEVEDVHNFIAGGICVHNSSNSPNWQNL